MSHTSIPTDMASLTTPRRAGSRPLHDRRTKRRRSECPPNDVTASRDLNLSGNLPIDAKENADPSQNTPRNVDTNKLHRERQVLLRLMDQYSAKLDQMSLRVDEINQCIGSSRACEGTTDREEETKEENESEKLDEQNDDEDKAQITAHSLPRAPLCKTRDQEIQMMQTSCPNAARWVGQFAWAHPVTRYMPTLDDADAERRSKNGYDPHECFTKVTVGLSALCQHHRNAGWFQTHARRAIHHWVTHKRSRICKQFRKILVQAMRAESAPKLPTRICELIGLNAHAKLRSGWDKALQALAAYKETLNPSVLGQVETKRTTTQLRIESWEDIHARVSVPLEAVLARDAVIIQRRRENPSIKFKERLTDLKPLWAAMDAVKDARATRSGRVKK